MDSTLERLHNGLKEIKAAYDSNESEFIKNAGFELAQAHKDLVQRLYKESESEIEDACPETKIEAVDHVSRDGFTPFSYNKGGYETQFYISLYDYFNDEMETVKEKIFKQAVEYVEDETGQVFDSDNEVHHDKEEEYLNDLNYVFVEIRAMFNGDGETTISIGANISDAPYYRDYDTYKEIRVEYADVEDFKNKVSKINFKGLV